MRKTRQLILKGLFSIIALLFMQIGFSQSVISVSGKVSDSTGMGIPNVSVKVQGNTTGAITNNEGGFTLRAPQGSTLEFTYVGFLPEYAEVRGDDFINVVLIPTTESAGNEVVVTALGIRRLDKNLGYAATTVGGEEIARTNTVNPIAGLQGKVAGLNINVMGAAGVQTTPSILLRGAKSLTGNNQPIFVIDGVVVSSNVVGADALDNGSQLLNLNPDDYESISVLKGAAATSVYGSRGANGAIVITTKRGKLGTGLGISATSTYQTENIYANTIGLQDKYGMGSWLTREGNFAPDGTQVLTSYSWGAEMDGRMVPALWDNTVQVPYSPQPDNWRTFYQNGRFINNNVAIDGGSEKATYRLSYTNTINDGVLPNNGLRRNTWDFKTTGVLNKVFSFDGGLTYSNTKMQNFYNQSRWFWTSGQNLGFLTYYAVPRNADLAQWYQNYRNPDYSMRNYNYSLWTDQVNAAFNRFDNLSTIKNDNSLLAFAQLKAQITPKIDLTGRANLNYYKTFTETQEKGGGALHSGGAYGLNGNYNYSYNYIFTGHYTDKFMNEDLGLDLIIGNEIYGNDRTESYGSSTNGGLIVPDMFTLNNSVNDRFNRDHIWYGYAPGNNRVVGLYAIANLNYRNFLNLELTARNDWLSSLVYPASVPEGQNNYTVFYPSANLSWIFSEQFKNSMPEWLSFGRLRASVSEVGNGTQPFATSFNTYTQGSVLDMNGNTVITADLQNSSVLPNYNVKPEIQRSMEVGANVGLFRDRINFDIAYYRTNTFNQILRIPYVSETGYSNRLINAGNIANRGVEFLINATPVRNKDLRWDVSLNFAHNRGKIIEFYPGITGYQMMGNYDGVEVWAYEGGDYGVMQTSRTNYRERDPQTGFPIIEVGSRYVDNNAFTKNNIQDYNWIYQENDPDNPRHTYGKVEPDLIGGFNTTLRWKSFTFFAQLDGRLGGYTYSQSLNYSMQRGIAEMSLRWRDQENGGVKRTDSYTGQERYNGMIPDAVFAEGQVSPITGVNIGGMTFQQAYDQGLVEPWTSSLYHLSTYGWGASDNESTTELSWLMLRELSLAYSLPSNFLNRFYVKNASLRFSARNIGYLYNSLPSGQNPANLQSNNPFMPVMTGGIPFSRNFAVTLMISL